MPGRTRAARIALSFMLILSACSNVLEPTAGKATDDALYEDAIKAMNNKDYTTALAKFSSMSGGYKAKSKVLENWGYAYAGDCGLDFISYFNQLSSASMGATTFFKYLMNAWTGIAIKPASCRAAEDKIKELWAANGTTASQQLFMSVLGLVKMGVYLRSKADIDGAGGLGDGSVDAAFGGGTGAGQGACTSTAGAHNLIKADVQEIVTGLSLFVQNVAGLSASLSSDLQDSLDDLDLACQALSPNPCATTDVSGVTDPMVDSMRDLLATQPIGIGPCMNPMVSACCP